MTTDLSGVEQLPQPDPRGWLALRNLPAKIQNLEDSTAMNDRDRMRPRGFERPATETERILLQHLGFTVPADLVTVVTWPSRSVRRRRWPALEGQSLS
jgi:hypothetical protein